MFEKVAGNEGLKKELSTILGWYADQTLPKGTKLPRGVLLVGRPGSGKTLFLRAIQEKSPLPVYSYEDSGEKDVVAELQEVFEKAAKEPNGAIVMLDELDELLDENHRLERSLKEWMDGLILNERILVVASANNLSKIDCALLRPGRFDRVIRMKRPSKKENRKIISYYLKAHNQSISEERLDFYSDLMANCSPADIAAIIEDACLRNQNKPIIDEMIERSYQVVYCEEIPEEDDLPERVQIVCIHEAGHAIMVDRYRSDFSMQFLSVTSTSNREGTCYYTPIEKAQYTLEHDRKQIEIMIGGYLATKILLGIQDNGSAKDLVTARYRARCLVNSNGYHGIRHVLRQYNKNERNESWLTCFFNERRATKVLRQCERNVERYIKQNREKILQLASELQETGILRGKRIREVMATNQTTV